MTDMTDATYDLLMIANFAWKRGAKAITFCQLFDLAFVVATGTVGKLKVG